jgi:exonuclease III
MLKNILIWNCNKAFRKKYHHLDDLPHDLAVISECEDPGQVKFPDDFHEKYDFKWTGKSKNGGLGVFVRKGLSIEILPEFVQADLSFILPVRISDNQDRTDFHAVWAQQTNSHAFRYIGQIWKYLDRNLSRVDSRNTIFAGDFNSNAIWDVEHGNCNHSDVVEMLGTKRIYSVYHEKRNESHGEETTDTFFLQKNRGKAYHIDYCFMSEDLLSLVRTIEYGKYEDWMSVSDHVPIVVECA